MMSLFLLRVCTSTTLLLAIVTTPALAAGKKKKPKPEPVVSSITAVSGESITVTTGNVTKTVTVKSNSEVVVNGQKAGVAALQAGMVVGSLSLGTDPTVVSRISVANAPAGESKKK